MWIRKGVYFIAPLVPCCLLCPEGQQGTSTSITLLQSCTLQLSRWKWKLRTLLRFLIQQLSQPTPNALSESKEHTANSKDSIPDRTGKVQWFTQHFILQNPEGMHTMQWTSSWTEVKEALLELHLSTWEMLDQHSTQTDAYKRWKKKKPGLSSWTTWKMGVGAFVLFKKSKTKSPLKDHRY